MKLSVLGFVILVSVAWDMQAAEAEQPNVLFLFADDMRADTIAAHGNAQIQTPNLDKLSASGFSFHGNYTFGGNSGAVCIPSRAMLMTGKTWFHLDVSTLAGSRLLPEYLQTQGYRTFGTGKWHNGPAAYVRAFQQGKTVMFGGMSDHTDVPVHDLRPDGTLTEARPGGKFSTELFADSAIEFLKTQDGSRPFFAYVAFTAPHDPRQPPAKFSAPYYRDLPPLPKNFLPQLPFDNGMMNGTRDENLGAWPRTEKMIREQLAEYYGMITHLDEQIGRILEVLEQTGLHKNTIVVFTADNGLAMGSHGLLGKQSVFEHSMRTPLIIAGPGIKPGASSAFTYLLDLFPTLCETLQVPIPAGMEGHSLRPIWEGKSARVRDSVFLPFLDIQRGIRDERWKLIAYPRLGYLQLFDLKNDPGEIHDVASVPGNAGQIERLRRLMAQWQEQVDDPVTVPPGNKKPPRIDLTGKPRQPDPWQPDWIVKKYFERN